MVLKTILERQSFSQLKMGRDSPVCRDSAQYYHKMKRFSGIGRNLCARDKDEDYICNFQVLGPHWIKNRHDSVMEITWWTHEHVQKWLSICKRDPEMLLSSLNHSSKIFWENLKALILNWPNFLRCVFAIDFKINEHFS